ncbi:hypothetical protein EVAR_43504_1 [Eumeta japonica]|uniref:Uncharacterized protein n=1 Tax=Eumeta variegata TaxID=151549 RepID=A0A4C1YHN4_EUMVA|nr:hypothetical protein EVAR_43504_1 [Eumeta japonica]
MDAECERARNPTRAARGGCRYVCHSIRDDLFAVARAAARTTAVRQLSVTEEVEITLWRARQRRGDRCRVTYDNNTLSGANSPRKRRPAENIQGLESKDNIEGNDSERSSWDGLRVNCLRAFSWTPPELGKWVECPSEQT